MGAAGFSAGIERSPRMILSDREIRLALRRDHFRITPPPADKAISSTSVDLTLHEEISWWNLRQQETDAPVIVSPAMKVCQLILEEVHGTPEKGYEGLFATQAPEPSQPTKDT